jgi:hypothetical protein
MLESVKDSVANIVERFTDPYECWQHLSNRYEPRGGSRRLMLLRRLIYSRKEDSFSREQHLKSFKENWDQFQRINVPIPEDMAVLLLLASLPSEFKAFNRAQTKGMLPPFHEIELRLLDEELTLKLEAEKDDVSEALFLKRGPGSSCVAGKSGSRPGQGNSEQRNKNPRRDSRSNSSTSVTPKSNQKEKAASTECLYCKDAMCKGRFSEEQCELKKTIN